MAGDVLMQSPTQSGSWMVSSGSFIIFSSGKNRYGVADWQGVHRHIRMRGHGAPKFLHSDIDERGNVFFQRTRTDRQNGWG